MVDCLVTPATSLPVKPTSLEESETLPSPPNWSPGIAKLADKTFLATEFFQNDTNVEKNLFCLFTKRMKKMIHIAFLHKR